MGWDGCGVHPVMPAHSLRASDTSTRTPLADMLVPMTTTTATGARKGPPAEDVLLAYTQQLAADNTGYRAIVFHLSRLPGIKLEEKQFRVATNMLMEVVDRFTGRLFVLRSRDIVIICKGLTAKAISEVVDALTYLFAEGQTAGSAGTADLYTAYDLEIGYHQFFAVVQALRDKEVKKIERTTSAATQDKALHRRVSDLIDRMSGVDLTNAVQRQTVWALDPKKKPIPKYDELFISIERLHAVLDVDFDLTKDRQLFRYLTQWLDKFLLTRLGWEQFGLARPVSININLTTLYSADFLKFDNEQASGWRGRTILELQLSDLWSDISAYLAIADLVRQRGYFRCLDGVKYDALPCLKLKNMKIDLVKLIWDDALLQLNEAATKALAETITDFGVKRIVLSRCDKQESIKFGQSLGIQLFQGWHLDRFVEIK
jgi:EAL domain-containing protein (putative c-di-GMP-specific phosphodiesterase class I)